MNELIDQVFFEECANYYPKSIEKNSLQQKLSISSDQLTDLIQKYKKHEFPLEETAKTLKFTLPMLSINQLSQQLKEKTIGSTLKFFPVIDSTNQWIKNQPTHALKNGQVVFAHKQLAGYGRNAKSWSTPAGKSVALTIVLKPTVPILRPYLLTQLTAAALYNSLKSYVHCSIKWPNDLLVNQKKIAGILTESVYIQKDPSYIQIGIGLNTNLLNADLPSCLLGLATSLREETGIIVDPNDIITDFLLQFENLYNNFITTDDAEEFLSICRKNSTILGETITVHQQNIIREGTAIDINKDGFLKVFYSDTQQSELLTAGEISIRPVY
ncbi:biotin--[acetyl-CoA-carboxylase] ligase [Lacticigenium naphthae]|uniref:biotin--[acetyl-CoA-carboxylase] ligase n=1 Tax=Lacticigenium naphthae TaxID=515351 RepID=UPI00042A5A79|nr:biotin--[acetyl-CoA-carboxylase] ligase [Lacticigenium naphthae]